MVMMVFVKVVGGLESYGLEFYVRGIILLFNYCGGVWYILLRSAFLFSKVRRGFCNFMKIGRTEKFFRWHTRTALRIN